MIYCPARSGVKVTESFAALLNVAADPDGRTTNDHEYEVTFVDPEPDVSALRYTNIPFPTVLSPVET
jgi:hypothetical protein